MDSLAQHWSFVQRYLQPLHTEEEYLSRIEALGALIDEVGEDESHPLASLMEAVGDQIEAYENTHVAAL